MTIGSSSPVLQYIFVFDLLFGIGKFIDCSQDIFVHNFY